MLGRETAVPSRVHLRLAGVLVLGFALVPGLSRADESTFIRGDFTGDAGLAIEDAVGILGYMFSTDMTPPLCLDAADVNDDGHHNLADPVYLLSHLFIPGSLEPPAPFPICGIDPTPEDAFDCAGPLTGCFPKDDGPDLVFGFVAPDLVDDDPPVYLARNRAVSAESPFDVVRYGMRPLTLAAHPSLTTGEVQVIGSADHLELFASDGTPVPLPATFQAEDLPLELLVNGVATGRVELEAFAPSTGQFDSVTVQIGRFPGLAGRLLDAYPHMEFVRTFNDDEMVRTALDPGRHGERMGLPYDVYIVDHRTDAEWAADPTLVDVTGGIETSVVNGVSIAQNIVLAWGSGLDGGDMVGKGYDVVYDFGQDGTLDPGDLVSGVAGAGAGIYVVKNLNLPGPHPIASFFHFGGLFLGQKIWYPTDIDDLGQVPLVIISHGNGHQYTWYDYLMMHLASHGYIVMSHQNNTMPGIETASTTTLTNTDEILAEEAVMGGGVLDGHIDSSRIVWIGHSRGGEGVVRAYDRIFDGVYTPQLFSLEDIVLISSIAPTVFLGTLQANPHASNYHFLAGSADGDVTGGADCALCQFFRISQAGTGNVQVTYVQGADHNDFNCCGFNDGMGPAQIGRPAAQIVAKSYYIALVELYTQGNPAARDVFTRMYEGFHPSGIGANVICATQYEDGAATGNDIIDDYQQDADVGMTSVGGLVDFDVDNVWEARLDDLNSSFAWTPTDPMNGMTQAANPQDTDYGVVFDWPDGSERFYELEVLPDLRDFSDNAFLSFRACQGTRHPNTNVLAGPLDFTVTLVDGAGTASSINFGVYGRITRPYQRAGLGGGLGWANEYSTVRIRLADFENDHSGIDLTDIVAVRFEFGGAFGSPRGRIGIDDVTVTHD